MKILLIHNYYQYRGGEDVYFDALTQLLKTKGHDVYTYTKNSNDLKTLGDRIYTAIGMFWSKAVEKEFIGIIEKFRPDITHFNNIYPLITPIAYNICRKLKIPIVQSVHNYRFICPKATLYRGGEICELCIKKRFYYPSILYGCYHNSRLASFILSSSFLFHHRIKRSFDNIDHFIFHSGFTRNYYLQNFDFLSSKTSMIPHFAAINEKRKKQIVKYKDYFLFVGRLSEEKGIIPLLNLFSVLPRLYLVVIGDGPLRKIILTKYSRYRNIFIKYFLSQGEIFSFMKKALFTIIPSPCYETGSRAMIESFANRTPVLVPKRGMFINTVKDGETGLFFQPDNLRDLKEKIIYLWKNQDKIEIMRENVQKEYLSKYTPERHYNKLIRIYCNLVKANKQI